MPAGLVKGESGGDLTSKVKCWAHHHLLGKSLTSYRVRRRGEMLSSTRTLLSEAQQRIRHINLGEKTRKEAIASSTY